MVSDSNRTRHDANGLGVISRGASKDLGCELANFSRPEKLERNALLAMACNVSIPAALADVIRDSGVCPWKARLVIDGANITPC